MNSVNKSEVIISNEKFTINAFKEKDAGSFTKYFSDHYTGVANDGVKNAQAEIQGMNKLDLTSIRIEDENVFFAEDNLAIMTYKMMVAGKMDQQDISGGIYCSTVYLKNEKGWLAVLHTEAKAI